MKWTGDEEGLEVWQDWAGQREETGHVVPKSCIVD